MKVKEVKDSLPAWQAVAAMKKKPSIAFKLMTYYKTLAACMETIRKQLDDYVFEAAGVEPATPPDIKIVEIQSGTEQYEAYQKLHDAYLETETDLPPVGMTLQELVEGLDVAGNSLIEHDLEILEPFFTKAVQ